MLDKTAAADGARAKSGCAIDIVNVSKSYGKTPALGDVSLKIRHNEFFTLLGPSGCGKTTMLRIIAGFEDASGGKVFLFGEEIENLPPQKRSVNTVFQNYALFPHMSVFDNVMFGMKMLNMPDKKARERAGEMLELVKLSEYSARRPAQLSGGQRQRVALARALAPSPQVLLLDEPLSALDLKLRQAMRVELKQIQRETGITFIFVTHDQDEAMTMSDRIAIMSQGAIQQIGSPREIYETPINRYVAGFIGEVNLLEGTVEKTANGTVCVLGGGDRINIGEAEAGECCVAVRPEKARLTAPDSGDLHGVVERRIYIGAITETHVRLAQGSSFVVQTQNTSADSPGGETGEKVGISIEAVHVLRD